MERPVPHSRSGITFAFMDRERYMSKEPKAALKRIDQFFSGPGARADD